MLRYAVVGSGAVGCFYGIRLAHAGAPVQFLVRHGAEDVRAHGLDLVAPSREGPGEPGDIHLEGVRAVGDWAGLEPCDVLLVAVKATANAQALGELARHADRLLGRDGAVLLAQNGIGAEPGFAEAAGGREVLGGLAFLCAQRIGPRAVAHLDFGALTLGSHTPDGSPAGITPRMRGIAADLAVAGIDAILDEDLMRARWRKLMWNVPFNPLSVILQATTDALVADPSTVALIGTLMAEVAAVAAAEGHPLPEGLADDLLAVTARMAPYATSMMLDAQAGRPLELQALLGEPLLRAEQVGVPMPGVAVLQHELAFLDRRGRTRA